MCYFRAMAPLSHGLKGLTYNRLGCRVHMIRTENHPILFPTFLWKQSKHS